jgi:hypothetical protein
VSIHIPDVERAYGNMLTVKQRLDRAISEIKKTIIENNMPRDVAHDVFFQTQTDQKIQALMMELSIIVNDATNILTEIPASRAKRGRKFRHWERMLVELMAKVDKVYGNQLRKYGVGWADVPE